ncbi:MAG: bifunctional 2-C-methyl-D-erythritol 4-phosphate cytidylyltransferase/2-C-methyl-D-erythritol 2,4-cyclodiphosphate synthase [Rhodospirillales bacterium]|nr:bifunctional 2-C-methyl-D-erythritol 4-phosphate cytidylyltransferase/2-C-methyl-D-erythritol 2,4-cyclodiphosphate synthase [Rhodospirillales bacterium]
MNEADRCIALLVSAGRGHRIGGEIPKQYLDLGGASLIRRSAEPFLNHPGVDGVVAVIHPDDREIYNRAVDGLALAAPITGGSERQDSVRLGLEALGNAGPVPGKVLIHDAVRPFVSEIVISNVINAVGPDAGAIPALAVVDTLKRGAGGRVGATVPRADLWRAQTPQGFPYPAILEAHRAAKGLELTDDAAVAEAYGLAVALVAGDENNFKVTGADDLARAERFVQVPGSPRVGMGFDVHRFADGRPLFLGGIEIPHGQGLAGHSDADVALHAIVDALLGAIGAGDIGVHFPPEEAKWKDAPSHIFLKAAGDAVAEASGVIRNIDLTVICEAPKIGPYREQMRSRISDILSISAAAVNIKATTTERLGFTGRGEGIAAQAVATVEIFKSK